MPRLEWNENSDSPTSCSLREPEIFIGRRSDLQIVLTHPLVSRRHAGVAREGESFVITDLQSTHGTWVNGERIERRVLKSGDKIRLGEHGVELRYLEAEGAAEHAGTTLFEGMGIDRTVLRLAEVLPEESSSIHSELEKISCLLDFHYSFGKAFSADRTFHHILKSALGISGAERGFILRKEHGEFAFAVGLDSAGNTLGQGDFHTSGSVVDRAEKGGEAVFMTQGIHGDLAASESIVAMNLRAVACLPLEATSSDTGAGAVVGILYLDSRKYMHALSGLDEKLLTRLAGEAGNVIEKLDMVVALAEKKRIEQELAVAEETQRSLLPQSLPEVAPFRIRAFSRPTLCSPNRSFRSRRSYAMARRRRGQNWSPPSDSSPRSWGRCDFGPTSRRARSAST